MERTRGSFEADASGSSLGLGAINWGKYFMLEEFLSAAKSSVRFAMFCSYLDIAKLVGFIWVRLIPWARQPVDYHPLHSFLGEH